MSLCNYVPGSVVVNGSHAFTTFGNITLNQSPTCCSIWSGTDGTTTVTWYLPYDPTVGGTSTSTGHVTTSTTGGPYTTASGSNTCTSLQYNSIGHPSNYVTITGGTTVSDIYTTAVGSRWSCVPGIDINTGTIYSVLANAPDVLLQVDDTAYTLTNSLTLTDGGLSLQNTGQVLVDDVNGYVYVIGQDISGGDDYIFKIQESSLTITATLDMGANRNQSDGVIDIANGFIYWFGVDFSGNIIITQVNLSTFTIAQTNGIMVGTDGQSPISAVVVGSSLYFATVDSTPTNYLVQVATSNLSLTAATSISGLSGFPINIGYYSGYFYINTNQGELAQIAIGSPGTIVNNITLECNGSGANYPVLVDPCNGKVFGQIGYCNQDGITYVEKIDASTLSYSSIGSQSVNNGSAFPENSNDFVSCAALDYVTGYYYLALSDPINNQAYIVGYSTGEPTGGCSGSVTGISPSSAQPGDTITITGTGFTGVTAVTIGGISASYVVVSTTTITATVPFGAADGEQVVVTISGNPTSSPGDLTVPPIQSALGILFFN